MVCGHRSVWCVCLLSLVCLGCGLAENTKLANRVDEYLKLDRETCDLLCQIHDEQTLNASSAEILAKSRKLCELHSEISTSRAPKTQVKRIKAKVKAQQDELESKVAASIIRIAKIPGGKKFIRSFVAILGEGGMIPGYTPAMLNDMEEDIPTLVPDGAPPGIEKQTFHERNPARHNIPDPRRQMGAGFVSHRPSTTMGLSGTGQNPQGLQNSSTINQIDLSDKTPQELVSYFTHYDSEVAIRAIRRINRVEPDSVSNEVKRDVAQTLKRVAFDRTNNSRLRNIAIEGLVLWGGKYSVPLLLELLEEEDADSSQQGALLKALNHFEDYSAVEPAAKILAKGDYNMTLACEYLIKSGPDAEQAVLDHVRPTTFFLTQETIRLLGRIGTRKSFEAFKLLRRSTFYPALKQEVDDARKAILEREKDAGGQ